MLCKEDISAADLKAAKIVHFGSGSHTADPTRTATLDAVHRTNKTRTTITYDPNDRITTSKTSSTVINITLLIFLRFIDAPFRLLSF